MFNAPRAQPRYGANTNGGFGGSYVDENPLAASAYDTLDPWSAAPSPSSTPAPPPAANNSVFSSVIADATVPAIYNQSFQLVDTNNTGEVSVTSLSRVLGTSSLPAATIDKIVNLVSNRPRVSKLEFFVALALVALAQAGKDVSIEQVAALSSQNTLPEPTLDLSRLPPSASTFVPNNYRQNSGAIRAPVPAYATDDPWNTNSRVAPVPTDTFDVGQGNPAGGVPSSLSGTGLPPYWWKKQDTVNVTILGQQGFILNRYTVYEISSSRSAAPVPRRYSEFAFVWECLLRRYPFRLFPALPPKRIGADEVFIEQRRRGLARSLNFVVNHPVIKEDALLAAFLTEPSFELWRKNTPISLDEESVSKRVDRNEEMTIPSDLEEKLVTLRRRINPLIEQWQRICILAERIIKRREAAAVRIPPAFRPGSLQAHFSLPFSSPALSSVPSLASSTSSATPAFAPLLFVPNMMDSIFGGFQLESNVDQGDMARLTNTLRVLVEVNEQCWRGDDCELSSGVRVGLQAVAAHTQRSSELSELRTRTLFDTTLESIKAQRDLYVAMKDLLIRNDRLSIDQVERLKQRVETTSIKLDGVKAAQKEGWEDQVEQYVAAIEKDQATIAAQLSRRVFIRACLWHELRVVLHNRENALLSQIVQTFAREEQSFGENMANTWASLAEAVTDMPYE